MKIDFWPFIGSATASIGLLPVPKLELIETDVDATLEILDEHGGPIPFICRDSRNPFFQNGVSWRTKSCWGHAGVFCGERNGQRARKKYSELLLPRPMSGLFTDHDAHLPPVPPLAKAHEVIESKDTVTLTSWPETIHDGIQAVAFLRAWDDEQAGKILRSAYWLYGAPYDVLEIAHDVFPLVWNPQQLKVCSSFVVSALSTGDNKIIPWMRARGIDPDAASPGDLGKYLFDSVEYCPFAFRCNLDEARKKT